MRIDYTANLKVANQNNKYIIEIILGNFTTNEVVPDDKISSLSLACMKSIYPIGFVLSDKGTPYAVFNFENLKKRFAEKRSEIEGFYTGEITQKYLNTFSEKLTDERYFFNQIQSNFLYQILFVDLKWFHKKTKWQEEINIYPNTFPLLFSFDKQQFFENAEVVQTKISGTLSERCSFRELLKGIKIENEDTEDDIYAETEIRYLTHQQTKQLQSAHWSVKIWHQDELFHQYQLHLTQI